MKKIIITLFIFAFAKLASATSGTIDPSFHTAQMCENVGCTVTTTTPVNFGYFTNTPSSNITVGDASLTGYMWGQAFGYVVLNCSQTSSGCSSTNGNFKVSNNNGTLSGYAWGSTAGWVNFGPFSNGTQQIVINSNGEMNGYAWVQNFGYIKFDCSNASYCVKTTWRASGSGSGGGSSSGGNSGGYLAPVPDTNTPTYTPEPVAAPVPIVPKTTVKPLPKKVAPQPTVEPSIQDFPVTPPQVVVEQVPNIPKLSDLPQNAPEPVVENKNLITNYIQEDPEKNKPSFWSFIKDKISSIARVSFFENSDNQNIETLNQNDNQESSSKTLINFILGLVILLIGLFLLIRRKIW